MTPLDWILSDDTGSSSKTIWGVMMGAPNNKPSIPYDPSDFGRCYRLLEHFPEWRPRLAEVAQAFPRWTPLVNAWPELEALYLEEKNNASGRAPKLYARMKELERVEVKP